MLKILFISFEFHPVQTTGNFRAAKFVKYFKSFGIDPIVLCGEEKSILQYYKGGKLNENLNKEIPEDITVYRVPFNKPYKPISKYSQFFYYSDPISFHWKENAENKAKEILAKHSDIKAIFVTVPPFSVHQIAYNLSIKYNLPLIVDLRDAWSTQGQFPYFTRIHFLLNRFYERRLLKRANAAVTVTAGLKKIYLDSNPGITSDKLDVVYNSFDNYDFEQSDPVNVSTVKSGEKFVIGYIGSYYYNTSTDKLRKTPWWKRKGIKKLFYFAVQEEWVYRSPYYLFKSLSKLFVQHPELKEQVYFGHVGGIPDWVKEMAFEFGLENNLIDYGFVNVDKLGPVINEFSALLITTEKIPVNQSFCLPSKTFDYIKYRKPILGLVKEGDLKIFLQKAGLATVIDPDDFDDTQKLERFLMTRQAYSPDTSYISQFHASKQTAALAKIIINSIK